MAASWDAVTVPTESPGQVTRAPAFCDAVSQRRGGGAGLVFRKTGERPASSLPWLSLCLGGRVAPSVIWVD